MEENLKRTKKRWNSCRENWKQRRLKDPPPPLPRYPLLGMEGLKRIKNNRTVNIKINNSVKFDNRSKIQNKHKHNLDIPNYKTIPIYIFSLVVELLTFDLSERGVRLL